MSHRILIVEGDSDLGWVLREALTTQGYVTENIEDGGKAVTQASSGGGFDLILLDADLSVEDGFAVCRQLRERGIDTPILILTGRAEAGDKVLALQLGADDYVTKPFHMCELLARIQALLRRARLSQLASLSEYQFGNIFVDFFKGRVLRDRQAVSLSLKELHLLRYLIARKGLTVTREELLREVWGYQSTNTRTVDMHVAMVRQKLEDDPQQPRYIITVRGEGYLFRG